MEKNEFSIWKNAILNPLQCHLKKYLKNKEIEYFIHYAKFKKRPARNSEQITEFLTLEITL